MGYGKIQKVMDTVVWLHWITMPICSMPLAEKYQTFTAVSRTRYLTYPSSTLITWSTNIFRLCREQAIFGPKFLQIYGSLLPLPSVHCAIAFFLYGRYFYLLFQRRTLSVLIVVLVPLGRQN